MPIQHAVLALLASGPSYGYQLRTQFQDSIGPQWGELNIGHLYQVLDRLIRDGLAIREEVAQSPRPDKFVYHLTDSGAEELRTWLDTPTARPGGYRDDLFLKLLAAAKLGRNTLNRVLAAQRATYLEELASLTALRASKPGDELVDLLIEAALRHTQANLAVIEQAEQRAERLAPKTATRIKTVSSDQARDSSG